MVRGQGRVRGIGRRRGAGRGRVRGGGGGRGGVSRGGGGGGRGQPRLEPDEEDWIDLEDEDSSDPEVAAFYAEDPVYMEEEEDMPLPPELEIGNFNITDAESDPQTDANIDAEADADIDAEAHAHIDDMSDEDFPNFRKLKFIL